MKRVAVFGLTISFAGFSLFGAAAEQSATGQKIEGRFRVVPLYAFHKNRTPVSDLTTADLEIQINGSRVDEFTLSKGGSDQKMIFLVFDTASQPYHLLGKSKRIAAELVSRIEGRSRFVVMTIDPGSGLRVIQGPNDDRKETTRSVNQFVLARQSDYLQSRAAAGTEIRDVYPEWRDSTPGRMKKTERDLDRQADRQLAAVIISSLRTLNAILGRFPESSKIVHLYSCGIPLQAAANRSLIVFDEKDVASANNVEISSPDNTMYNQISNLGRNLRETGTILFLINPAGTRVGEISSASGKQTLRMLAQESSGLYLEGADKEIRRTLIEVERGYYEIRFSVSRYSAAAEAALVIRPKNPELTVMSVASLTGNRIFREMTPQEKQALILSILTDGLVGDVELNVDYLPAEISPAGEDVYVAVELPRELARSEWQIYKVWRNSVKSEVRVEVEHVLSESPYLTFTMAIRPDSVQDAVLVQAKTGTILVCRAKSGPKK